MNPKDPTGPRNPRSAISPRTTPSSTPWPQRIAQFIHSRSSSGLTGLRSSRSIVWAGTKE
jgi:hypothetical protein